MKYKFRLSCIFIFLFVLGCTKNQKDETHLISDKEAIRKHCENWIKVNENGNKNGYLNLITDDFEYNSPLRPSITNRDSLLSFLDSFYKNYTFTMSDWETREIIIRKDFAIHIWDGIAFIKNIKDGGQLRLDREYQDLYKKQKNGEWKCFARSYKNK